VYYAFRIKTECIFNLLRDTLRVGVRKVDLIKDGDHGKILVMRKEEVRDLQLIGRNISKTQSELESLEPHRRPKGRR
jgi:hypothetical protein